MIKKTKKIIIFTVIFSMGFAVLLSCCLPGISYADSMDVKSGNFENRCHSKSSETTNSTDSQCCKFHQTTAILDIKGTVFLKSKLSLFQPVKDLFLQRSFFNEISENPTLFSEYFPQLAFTKEIPLYLEYSVFRI